MESNNTLEKLKVQVQLDGNSGPDFPTDFSKLNHNSMFFNESNGKLYAIVQVIDKSNIIDKIIELRQGKFKWVEVVCDEEKLSYGNLSDKLNELTNYPNENIVDIFDIIANIYIKFDYTDPDSKHFLKDIKNGEEDNLKLIEKYLNIILPDLLNEKNVQVLNDCLMLMLYDNFTK